jgi:uncharacterized membrane protein SpoIIM required for sporulation/uncharacterized RDD family membrane protein YckC
MTAAARTVATDATGPMDDRLALPGIVGASPTGVPARLRIAGVGARAYAFTVDFNIRIALAFAWYATGAVLHSSAAATEVTLRRPREPDLWWTYAIEIPVVVIFLLYHPIVETLLRGVSPGKRFAGVRIATLEGGVPNTGALLLRNLFRLIDSAPMFYGVGLLMALFNRRSQRLGDLAAGTLLVYDDGRVAVKVPARGGFAAASALIDEHRTTARQLAVARRLAPQAVSTEALEARHAALHHELLREPPTLREAWRRFAGETLPAATHELRPFLGATLLGFVLAALAGYGLVTVEPGSIRLFASPEMLAQVREGTLWTQGLLGVAPSSVLSGAIFFNNAVVALTAWLLGFLFALGTLYAIGINGMMVGALAALCVANGLGFALLDFAVAHGPAEIFCLCAAGAAGAIVGEALARPGESTRGEAFAAAVRRTAALLPAIAIVLMFCGLIEGYVSTSSLPFAAKAAVGAGALAIAVSALVDWRGIRGAALPKPPLPDAPASR